MPLDISALSSISASLDELIARLEHIAKQGGEEDEAAGEVLEVERTLRTSSRRLNKILRQITR